MYNFGDGADKPQLHTYIVKVQCRQNSVVLIYFEKPEKKPEARG